MRDMIVTLLEKAFTKISKLPEEQQEVFTQWILDELEDEARWDRAFANSLPQLEKLGKKALADFKAGKTIELNPDELE
jgi:hypothetical protein